MKVLCPKCGAPSEAGEGTVTCAACGATFVAGEARTTAEPGAPLDPLLGKTIGGCRLVERIGTGGMGVVYKAEQISLGRPVAVKILPETHRQEAQLEERFRREIAVLARLNHPNIVTILDGGVADLGLYFVMELVDGVSLRRVISAGGLKPEEALRIIPQICDALEYAHARGVVHRDIKPENILLDLDGRVRLLDFGLSRLSALDRPEFVTRPTQVLGTFEYMAPEQREASGQADHRSDLYSLGVVIYEMLTGELPIGRFDPPSKKNVRIDVRIDDVVLRVLDKSPDRRYQRASELKTEVERISSGPTPKVDPTPPPQPSLPPVPPVPDAPKAVDRSRKLPEWMLWGGVAVSAIAALGDERWLAALFFPLGLALFWLGMRSNAELRYGPILWIGAVMTTLVGMAERKILDASISMVGLLLASAAFSRLLSPRMQAITWVLASFVGIVCTGSGRWLIGVALGVAAFAILLMVRKGMEVKVIARIGRQAAKEPLTPPPAESA